MEGKAGWWWVQEHRREIEQKTQQKPIKHVKHKQNESQMRGTRKENHLKCSVFLKQFFFLNTAVCRMHGDEGDDPRLINIMTLVTNPNQTHALRKTIDIYRTGNSHKNKLDLDISQWFCISKLSSWHKILTSGMPAFHNFADIQYADMFQLIMAHATCMYIFPPNYRKHQVSPVEVLTYYYTLSYCKGRCRPTLFKMFSLTQNQLGDGLGHGCISVVLTACNLRPVRIFLFKVFLRQNRWLVNIIMHFYFRSLWPQGPLLSTILRNGCNCQFIAWLYRVRALQSPRTVDSDLRLFVLLPYWFSPETGSP